jgi:hypothetical protein
MNTLIVGAAMIDNMYLRVAKILTFAGGQPLTNATGFFYMQDKFLYLITSRHVVINETFDHRPDYLQVSLHTNARDLQQRNDLSVPLYVNGVPQWYQHPSCNAIDVVAISVNDPNVLSDLCVLAFNGGDIVSREEPMPLGQDVLILGFPLGFHDTLHNLPIVRRATIASSFAHPFKGEPYFLTDGRLHRGMSGSPVIAKMPTNPETNGVNDFSAFRLLGVHSSSLDVSDRDPDQDEKLALNSAWYASLIPEMIPPPLSL